MVLVFSVSSPLDICRGGSLQDSQFLAVPGTQWAPSQYLWTQSGHTRLLSPWCSQTSCLQPLRMRRWRLREDEHFASSCTAGKQAVSNPRARPFLLHLNHREAWRLLFASVGAEAVNCSIGRGDAWRHLKLSHYLQI